MNRVILSSLTASLAFAISFMLSCSGADGNDGLNGTDGKNADCVFEPKPKTDSLLIICNDKLVGTIANGKIGADGRDGIDGANGIDGIDGRDGADGINGIDGADGVDGRDGADGVDGKNGVNGIDGKDGVDGKNGADGQNCDVIDSGAYFAMRCGGVEKAVWAKAMCGATAYDPAEMECNNNALSFYFTDPRDNKKYKAVTINSQTWMAENLAFHISGGLCYGDSESNCYIYGRLYNWETALIACPPDWHLPNDTEWLILIHFIGASAAGTKLKAKEGWNNNFENSIDGTDDYGFSALPGGFKGATRFSSLGYSGYWRSATEIDTDTSSSSAFSMSYYYFDINKTTALKTNLISVRCVKD